MTTVNKDKNSQQASNEIAEKNYEANYYDSNDALEAGLAMTHEQVSDMYTEGTIDGEIDDLDAPDNQIPRQNK